MQDSFSSISDCLQYWEFCPLCDKRNNIEVGFHDLTSFYETVLTNKELKLLDSSGNSLFDISLPENKIISNKINPALQPYIRVHCKGFHFSISYNMSTDSSDTISLGANKLLFFLKDQKTQIVYHVMSDYLDNETSVQLSENSTTVQDFTRELVPFNNLNKKSLVKRIRALSLLV